MFGLKSSGARTALLAVVIAGAVGFGQLDRVHAESGVSEPTATSFRWWLQLPRGAAAAGISVDLPSAIKLAQMGLDLSQDERDMIVSDLTAQAAAAGLPTTADAATAATPAEIGVASAALAAGTDE